MLKEPRSEVVAGVTIVSRHGVEPELVRMRRSILSLPKRLRSEVLEFFCDSKAGSHYLIEVRSAASADAIARFLPPLRASSVAIMSGGQTVREVRA